MKISLSLTEPKHIVVWCSDNEFRDAFDLLYENVTEGRFIERRRFPDHWEMYFALSYLDRLLLCIPFSHLSAEIEKIMTQAEAARLKKMEISHLDVPGLQRPLFVHQNVAVKMLANEEIELLTDDVGLNKGLIPTTPVLTPQGWKPIAKIKNGDALIGQNGKITRVVGVYPQPKQRTYKVTFSDGASVITDGGHLWQVQNPMNRWLIVTTKEIFEDATIIIQGQMPNGSSREYATKAGCHQKCNGHKRWRIPLVSEIHFEANKAPLLIDPYRLGVFLGDGHLKKTGSITITTDTVLLDQMRIKHRTTNCPYVSAGATSEYANQIKLLGLAGHRSWEKFIPPEYLRASAKDRLALLQGLLDTDGWAIAKGGVGYCTTSKQLMKDVVELVRSLGGITKRVRSKIPTYTYKSERRKGRRAWSVNIKLTPAMQPFRLARKLTNFVPPTKYPPVRFIESVTLNAPSETICLKVDAVDELFVIKDYIVTHNTSSTLAAIHLKHWFPALIAVGSVAGKYVWEREAAIMFPKLRVQVVEGTKANRAAQLRNAHRYHISIINVQALRLKVWDEVKGRMVDEYGEMAIERAHHEVASNPDLFNVDWEVFVADEFHKFQNPSAQQTRGFFKLDCGRFIGLSGTPILSRPEQAWPFLHKCDDQRFPTFYHFEQQIGKFTRTGKLIGYDPHEMLKVKNWLNDHSLRRRKEHVSDDLPQVVNADQVVEMTPEQRKIYNRVRDEMVLQMEDGTIKNVFDARVQVMRLKQACFSPELFGGSRNSGKIEQMKEDVAQLIAGGHKAIIFSEWATAARILQREFAEYNPAYVDGSIKARDRPKEEDKFNNDDTCGCYIGTIRANQEAITLSAATYVLFADLEWVPMANYQAAGRSAAGGMRGMKLGKDQKVTIVHYQAENTIEQRLATELWKKQKHFNAFIERDAGATMQKMTVNKLRQLI